MTSHSSVLRASWDAAILYHCTHLVQARWWESNPPPRATDWLRSSPCSTVELQQALIAFAIAQIQQITCFARAIE